MALTLVLEEGGDEINSCWGEGEGVSGMDMILMLCFFLGSDREVRGEGGNGDDIDVMLLTLVLGGNVETEWRGGTE